MPDYLTPYIMASLVVAVFVVPAALGVYLARWLRMPDYGWKLGLIFFVFTAAVTVLWFGWPPKLGYDLSGGAEMVYELDKSKLTPGQPAPDMTNVIEALIKRLNPAGTSELTIRKFGADQIEIIVPNVKKDELNQVKSIINRIGSLEFRILASDRADRELIEQARDWATR